MGVRVSDDEFTVKGVTALTAPTVTAKLTEPMGDAGTRTVAVKLPFASVPGAGKGSAEITPIVSCPIKPKAGKSLPVTVI